MRKGCSNLVPGRLLQGLPLGTKLQETVLWCTLQSPSVPVSLSQSPSMAISTSMCLATSLSLAPCEEGPFLHNLGIRKEKKSQGIIQKLQHWPDPWATDVLRPRARLLWKEGPAPGPGARSALLHPRCEQSEPGRGHPALASTAASSLTPGTFPTLKSHRDWSRGRDNSPKESGAALGKGSLCWAGPTQCPLSKPFSGNGVNAWTPCRSEQEGSSVNFKTPQRISFYSISEELLSCMLQED